MIENFLEFHGCFPALTRLQVRLTAHIGGIESSELGNVGMNQQCVAWEAGKFVLFPVGGGQGATTFGSHLASPARNRLSLFGDGRRTVLAVKGSLRRAQQRRALDRSGPFVTHSQ